MIAIILGIVRASIISGTANGSNSFKVHTANPPFVNPTPIYTESKIKSPILIRENESLYLQ